jgi:hypothetical protein
MLGLLMAGEPTPLAAEFDSHRDGVGDDSDPDPADPTFGPRTLLSAAEFAACLDPGSAPSACVPSASCEGIDLQSAFPACGQATIAGMAACVGERASCLACRAQAELHGLLGVCPACP